LVHVHAILVEDRNANLNSRTGHSRCRTRLLLGHMH
jgi:hypothetical protein